MLYYLLIFIEIFKIFVFFLVSNLFWVKVVSLVLLLFLLNFFRSIYLKPRNVGLNSYKITSIYTTIFYVFFYLVVFILALSVYRFMNVFRELNLKYIYVQFCNYITLTTSFNIVITVLLLFTFVLNAFIIYMLLKVKLRREINKAHIYMQQYSWYFDKVHFIAMEYLRLLHKFYMFVDKFYKVNYIRFCNFFDFAGLLLIVCCLFYDMFVNYFVLTKMYYVFPFTYIHLHIVYLKNFLGTRSVIDDEALSNYYYKKHTSKVDDGIFLENGDFLSYEDIEDLRKYILRDFKIEGLTKTKIV